VNITVYNAFGYITGSTGNSLATLENNGTTRQIEAFDQNGDFIAKSAAINGSAYLIDNDSVNHKLRVWHTDGGTLEYLIRVYA
jgi:hypothetical protein